MKRLLLSLAALSALAYAQVAAKHSNAPSQPALFAEIPAIERGLSEITGLAFVHPVPYGTITKDELRRYLDDRIRETTKGSELKAEETALKLLGFVPPDFDLRQNTIDLLTEQAAAFYDYNKKRLFILEGTDNSAEEQVALAHELAHALADQHFHLNKYIHEGLESDDASNARQAVMEGQASWLMAAYISKRGGGAGEVPEAVLDLMSGNMAGAPGEYPVFDKAPPYIRETLVFPYSDGMKFQQAVYRKMGKQSFSEVFRNPPVSTQQVMHPVRYLDHSQPSIPHVPPIPDPHQFRELGDGTLGELDFRILLSQYAGKEAGEALSTHLKGASYDLREHKHDIFPVIAYAATWDSADAARQYFELLRKVLAGKWKKLEITSDTATRLEGHGDTGYFQAWLDGATVNHLEGWKTPLH